MGRAVRRHMTIRRGAERKDHGRAGSPDRPARNPAQDLD